MGGIGRLVVDVPEEAVGRGGGWEDPLAEVGLCVTGPEGVI